MGLEIRNGRNADHCKLLMVTGTKSSGPAVLSPNPFPLPKNIGERVIVDSKANKIELSFITTEEVAGNEMILGCYLEGETQETCIDYFIEEFKSKATHDSHTNKIERHYNVTLKLIRDDCNDSVTFDEHIIIGFKHP